MSKAPFLEGIIVGYTDMLTGHVVHGRNKNTHFFRNILFYIIIIIKPINS
jgi:hypothetical protein